MWGQGDRPHCGRLQSGHGCLSGACPLVGRLTVDAPWTGSGAPVLWVSPPIFPENNNGESIAGAGTGSGEAPVAEADASYGGSLETAGPLEGGVAELLPGGNVNRSPSTETSPRGTNTPRTTIQG